MNIILKISLKIPNTAFCNGCGNRGEGRKKRMRELAPNLGQGGDWCQPANGLLHSLLP